MIKFKSIIIAFFSVIVIFDLIFIFSPKKVFSEQENRPLQSFPTLNRETISDGTATQDIEKFISDHFPLRDQWITGKAAIEYLLGKRVSNNVYYGKNGQLFAVFNEPAYNDLDMKLQWINSFKNDVSIPVYFSLIPGASCILTDYLPDNAPIDMQDSVINYCYQGTQTTSIDLRDALKQHKNEYIYYKTDHHWSSYGAFLGYQKLINELKGNDYFENQDRTYNIENVNSEFYGTLYSSSGYTWVSPDIISKYGINDSIIEKTYINGIDQEPLIHGLYFDENLNIKDKYQYYLGGISPLIHITNTSVESPSSLLIIRDSYSDCLAPFLAQDYSDVYLIDLRYYKSSIKQFLNENSIDQVLIMYSVSNFSEDKNLGFLIG